jgi:hypothetical protein
LHDWAGSGILVVVVGVLLRWSYLLLSCWEIYLNFILILWHGALLWRLEWCGLRGYTIYSSLHELVSAMGFSKLWAAHWIDENYQWFLELWFWARDFSVKHTIKYFHLLLDLYWRWSHLIHKILQSRHALFFTVYHDFTMGLEFFQDQIPIYHKLSWVLVLTISLFRHLLSS